jgi:hypothetical protein
MPWNKDPSGQQKEDARTARDLQKKQQDLLAQQERETSQRRKKLNAQQVAMLRARFGVSGSTSGGGGGTGDGSPQAMSDSAGSLFARITGR